MGDASALPSPSGLSTALHWAHRLGVAVFAGFWGWFLGCNLVYESFDWHPMVGLGILVAVTAVAWCRPHLGGALLLAFAAWAAWFFAGVQARWLLALPAAVLGVSGLLLPRR